jgi:PAS domain S-box-containing protein
MPTRLESEVRARFGILPNFFRLTTEDPEITANLWGFAQFAYLDNPLPSLLKERLFVYLSLFCRVRYCIARHIGFLVGLGRPAGDPECLPQLIEEVLPLLRRDLPFQAELDRHIALCRMMGAASLPPEPNSVQEKAIFACAAHLFLKTPDAPRALEALECVFDKKSLEYTKLLLAFIRTAHYWTEIHPDLVLEDDINQLLTAHEALAACVLADAAELPENLLVRRASEELISLRSLKERQSKLEQEYDLLDTRHQKTEKSLFETEQDLHYLVVLGSQIPWTADAQGQLLYFEPRWLSWVGLSLDQVLGDKWLGVVHPDDLDSTRDAWAHSVLTGEPLEIEYRLRDAAESYVWVLSRAVPRRDAAKRILKWYGTTENIEGRKAAELAIRQSEKLDALGRLANSIAHEINNPLEAMMNLLYLAATTEGLPASARESLAAADAELQRVAHITRQTLGFYRESVAPVNVGLNSLIESVIALLRRKIGAKRILIENQWRAAQEVSVVAGELRQVFSNLLMNCLDAVDEGGTVKLRVGLCTLRDDRPGIRITFSDNGKGIEAAKRSRIFEPLYTTKDEWGTGLGLTISKEIVEKHQGRIQMRSATAGPRRGSTFSILLER